MLKRNRGVILIIISVFFASLEMLFMRLAGDDIPGMQKIFFSYLPVLVLAAVNVRRDRVSIKPPKSAWAPLFLRTAFGFFGTVCCLYSLKHLVIADATMLNKMSPFFTILFSFLLLKEKIRLVPALMVVAAFAGSLLVIKPSPQNLDLMPSLIGLLGGMMAGAAYTMVRKLGNDNVPGSVTVFYFAAGCVLGGGVSMLFDYQPLAGTQLMWLLLGGVVILANQITMTQAYRYQPASEISIFDYVQLAFTALLGLIIFGEVPDWLSVVGYVVVVGAAVGVFLFNNRKTEN